MEKVLLAVDGMTPDKSAFHYAVQLCKRIQTELNVLQIIDPQKCGEYLARVHKKDNPVKRYIEESLVAAAFAEAGEHETAKDMMSEAFSNLKQLLFESERQGVRCHLTQKSGNPKQEIVNYLHQHRDVVLTIYDTHDVQPGETTRGIRRPSVIQEIKRALSIPLVVLKGSDKQSI
jgi:nucleotide-binding universal stress UspA family protein